MPFITFEGIDGSGKSTLLEKFATHLEKKGLPVETTCEPGGSNFGPELRNILLRTEGTPPCPRAELLIYEADRAQHVYIKIRPWLRDGKWVLSDRFSDSSTVFQGKARGLKLSDIDWLNQFATEGLKPDLTIVLDCPVEVSLARMKNRKTDRFENEKLAFHETVRKGYLELAKGDSKRFHVLDGTKPSDELLNDLVAVVVARDLL